MDEITTDEHIRAFEEVPLPWRSAQSITLAHEHNVRCFDALWAHARAEEHHKLPSFVLQNHDLFVHLNEDARRRAAEHPFVLADIHFQNHHWLQTITDHPTASPANPAPANHLPPELCYEPMFEILLSARQTARENILTAKVVFGMSEAFARHLASLTLGQVKAIATHNTPHLRIRFDTKPDFWRRLLTAAKYEDIKALKALRHQAKRLFFGEVLQASPLC